MSSQYRLSANWKIGDRVEISNFGNKPTCGGRITGFWATDPNTPEEYRDLDKVHVEFDWGASGSTWRYSYDITLVK